MHVLFCGVCVCMREHPPRHTRLHSHCLHSSTDRSRLCIRMHVPEERRALEVHPSFRAQKDGPAATLHTTIFARWRSARSTDSGAPEFGGLAAEQDRAVRESESLSIRSHRFSCSCRARPATRKSSPSSMTGYHNFENIVGRRRRSNEEYREKCSRRTASRNSPETTILSGVRRASA